MTAAPLIKPAPTLESAMATINMLSSCSDVSPEHHRDLAESIITIVQKTGNLMAGLGSFIHVRKKPFTLELTKCMYDMFNVRMPRYSIYKCARQVGKSTNIAAKTILLSSFIEYLNTLLVTPQFEMTRRFSANYMQPMLEDSPIGKFMVDKSCERNVLQRSLVNNAIMHFSYAGDTADRVRGIPGDRLAVDEVQDVSKDLVDEMAQVLKRSKYRIVDLSGTPKTFDNTIQVYWEKSSMSEWVIPCLACGMQNIPSMDHHALKMIGLKTLICSKCGKPLDANCGAWVPRNKDKVNSFVGWHVPQIILPFHYQDPSRWREITDAMDGAISKRLFFNEIMGESCDQGAKLLTLEDLHRACRGDYVMDYTIGRSKVMNYTMRVLGVDWGGRGEDSQSFTKVAVVGLTPKGTIDVLYAENLSNLMSPSHEVVRCIEIARHFRCTHIAHDTSGTAGTRDSMLDSSGWPMNNLLPMSYTAPWSANLITAHEPTTTSNRFFYSVNKARSIGTLCEYIKAGIVWLPAWSSIEHFATDFLALVEESRENDRGSVSYVITRATERSDDFVHALNYAVLGVYYLIGEWPDVFSAIKANNRWVDGTTKEADEHVKFL